MPLERKPLFRPEALRPALLRFPIPGPAREARPKLAAWAELLKTHGRALKEKDHFPRFLADVFGTLLGYRERVDADPELDGGAWTLSREQHVEVGGKYADAALGRFTAGAARFAVAVEGKGPSDPLDRPHGGRKLSAVDQAYRYAVNLPCDWVVVTNLRETRLYHKGSDQRTYERFRTEDLATKDAVFARFLFLLGADRVVPAFGGNHLPGLLERSEREERDLTKKFYAEYAARREDAFGKLAEANPDVPRPAALGHAQTLLDRVLFCAFCEDRGLLPRDTLKKAFEHADPYNPRPVWENFRGLFRAVDRGDAGLKIPAYNGGLFRENPELDGLTVPDAVCAILAAFGEYDYRPPAEAADDAALIGSEATPAGDAGLVDVEILGHIFERSITDLERLRGSLEPGAKPESKTKIASRRKREGAFYTPEFVTGYVVDQALGEVLRDRFGAVRAARRAAAGSNAAKSALNDPRTYESGALTPAPREALVDFWTAWLDDLKTVRVLDPACGSGAFLIAAFDALMAAHAEAADRLDDLRGGQRELYDAERHILTHNLYGVDLNAEAVEICRLSLWIKTARRDRPLTDLHGTVVRGNSVVADPAAHPAAFDWPAAFPDILGEAGAGGFDAVVGNPPYVRQEWLGKPAKDYFEGRFASYHGMADLYVYFYERGFELLKPGGRLAYVVTNKWLRAGYAEPLRRFLAENAELERVVDLGHAREVFEDADVFPSILALRKPNAPPKPRDGGPSALGALRVCVIPRDEVRIDDLGAQVEAAGFPLPQSRLGPAPWRLEPPAVDGLMSKIERAGAPLAEFAGCDRFRGVTTGCNAAFLIDTPTRDRLLAADPNTDEIVKPYLRGQDVGRWVPEWAGLWMIFARRGVEIDRYPAVKRYLEVFRERLEPKPKGWKPERKGDRWPGRKGGPYEWFEVQDSVNYWQEFSKPKIFYQVIQFHPRYALDEEGTLSNDKAFFIPTGDRYLLAVLNSPVIWWRNYRAFTHLKDEALSPLGYMMAKVPVAEPTDELRTAVETEVDSILDLTRAQHAARAALLDWLRVEQDVAKPGRKLEDPAGLSAGAFLKEVKKRRGKGGSATAAALAAVRREYAATVEPMKARGARLAAAERRLAELVCDAYALTPADRALLWRTAPPRTPAAEGRESRAR